MQKVMLLIQSQHDESLHPRKESFKPVAKMLSYHHLIRRCFM